MFVYITVLALRSRENLPSELLNLFYLYFRLSLAQFVHTLNVIPQQKVMYYMQI